MKTCKQIRQGQEQSLPKVVRRGGFSKCLNPVAWVRALRCNTVYITLYRSMRVPVSVRTSNNMADIKVLVDSGATNNFIKPEFVKRMGIGIKPLKHPRGIWNIDNMENKLGKITHSATLSVITKGQKHDMTFLVTDIGNEDMLHGYPWLATYEPKFSWRHTTVWEDMLPIIIW